MGEEHPYKREPNNIINGYKKAILRLEVKITCDKITKLKNINSILQLVDTEVPRHRATNIKAYCQKQFWKQRSLIMNWNASKYKTLVKKCSPFTTTNAKNLVINYTNIDMPDEVNSV